jgi:hypothetical protein
MCLIIKNKRKHINTGYELTIESIVNVFICQNAQLRLSSFEYSLRTVYNTLSDRFFLINSLSEFFDSFPFKH